MEEFIDDIKIKQGFTGIGKIIVSRPRAAGKASAQKIHTELHALVSEIRNGFGETAKKGRGSFGFYLGFFKRAGVQSVRRLYAELKDQHGTVPKRLFWWSLARQLRGGVDKK